MRGEVVHSNSTRPTTEPTRRLNSASVCSGGGYSHTSHTFIHSSQCIVFNSFSGELRSSQEVKWQSCYKTFEFRAEGRQVFSYSPTCAAMSISLFVFSFRPISVFRKSSKQPATQQSKIQNRRPKQCFVFSPSGDREKYLDTSRQPVAGEENLDIFF